MDEQQLLLTIVKSWTLSSDPEYRGFRCAACQEYKNESWHHWLTSGGYIVPVHLCPDTCEPAFHAHNLKIALKPPATPPILANNYSEKTKETFEELLEDWNTHSQPLLKAFICDLCGKDLDIDPKDNLRKGFHVWYETRSKIKAELHFHKNCFESLS